MDENKQGMRNVSMHSSSFNHTHLKLYFSEGVHFRVVHLGSPLAEVFCGMGVCVLSTPISDISGTPRANSTCHLFTPKYFPFLICDGFFIFLHSLYSLRVSLSKPLLSKPN